MYRDECPKRGMLMMALRIFDTVHALVFKRLRGPRTEPIIKIDGHSVAEWDVRHVMACEKQAVLAGVHVVFSRVIPLESDPRQHPLWVLAEQYGASCGINCNEQTTHVVATHGGTEKVSQGKWDFVGLEGKSVCGGHFGFLSCLN